MPNPISTIGSMILLVFVMFYITTFESYQKQENLLYDNTYKAVTEFVDNVRFKGYITPEMYEDFEDKIDVSDTLFDIEIVHKHKVYNPIYTDPTNLNSFTGDYTVDYDEYYSGDIEDKLFNDTSVAYADRMYKMEKDDYFQIYIENKTRLKSKIIFDSLTGGKFDDDAVGISIPYGGMIHNEDY